MHSQKNHASGILYKCIYKVDRDSISKAILTLSYQSQNINLESDFLISTNEDKFLSVYCGVGVFIGSSFSETLKPSYNLTNSVSEYYAGSNVPVSDHIYYEERKEEILKNKPGLSFGTMINFGIEMRITRNIRFFQNLNPLTGQIKYIIII